ncbi:carbohydrate ABC transporter permease [Gracilibacillus alcaliphilus]|uniref:carbohydrate ABC transporter permease n=1 Tax=Gracilibacillus alcaliphilus TaxID=1401441 RepID=UPI00195D20C1|nr:carbohydrate ABC transporter permease [Gracilibacillus alcaliphilus]MBM7677728.1 putative aldouronate transport system permease protein [Gracilibacillus alcaliphilus]
MSKFKLNEDKLFSFFVYFLITVITILVALPLVYVLGGSLAPRSEFVTRNFFLIPKEISLDAYKYLFNSSEFLNALKNSIIITGIGTFINMLFTTLMAYGLSKRWLVGRSIINFMVLFTMLFSGGMIPLYLIVNNLGLLDSYWSIWLVGAISPFYLIVMRGLFGNIPDELEEAAKMDGCGEWRLLFSIALPLARPAMATFTIFYIVSHWNSYFDAILYLHDQDKMPLQVLLRRLIIMEEDFFDPHIADIAFSQAVPLAAIIITIVPLIIIFPFFQKYFNKGFLLGSVKD